MFRSIHLDARTIDYYSSFTAEQHALMEDAGSKEFAGSILSLTSVDSKHRYNDTSTILT